MRKRMTKLVWMIVISSLVIIVLFGIRSIGTSDSYNYWRDLCSALIGGAFSVLAAAILAVIIDIPSWLKDYDVHFARILTSNSYLKTLDESSLLQLRQDITNQIHKTTTPKMADGLLKLDSSICSLFKTPYYERYMHSVMCHKSANNTITKTHVVEYKLINPNCGYEDATEVFRISNLIRKRHDGDNGLTDIEISYRIDNEEEHKLTPEEYTIVSAPLDKKIEFYDERVCLTLNPQSGSELHFKECLRVKYSYTIDVSSEDRCFTKRLQHPAELFILNYSCEDDDIKLHGQLIGTDLKQSNFSIHYHDSNSISLVSYDWLLPDNGAFVVMLDKKETEQTEQAEQAGQEVQEELEGKKEDEVTEPVEANEQEQVGQAKPEEKEE